MMNAKLLNYEEAAELLHVRPQTLRLWVSHREIPFRKLGGKLIRFAPDDLEQWIESKLVEPVGRK